MAQEPVTERGRRTRAHLVQTAASLIGDHGVGGTSLDQVLAAAGASKSQLYHYFDDKPDLVRAVIACRFEQFCEAQAPLLEDLDSWASIRRWLDSFVAMNESAGLPGCPIGTLANELAGQDEPARAVLDDCFERMQEPLRRGLQRMQQRGDLDRRADPAALAIATWASLQGGLLLSKTARRVEPLRIAVDAAYDHLRSARRRSSG